MNETIAWGLCMNILESTSNEIIFQGKIGMVLVGIVFMIVGYAIGRKLHKEKDEK